MFVLPPCDVEDTGFVDRGLWETRGMDEKARLKRERMGEEQMDRGEGNDAIIVFDDSVRVDCTYSGTARTAQRGIKRGATMVQFAKMFARNVRVGRLECKIQRRI